MERPSSDAPIFVGCAALISAVVAHGLGWLFLIRALRATTHAVDAGVWMLGGAGLALVLDVLAIGLGATALLLRLGKRAPFSLPIAVVAIVLGVVGLVGVAALGLFGLVFVTPGVR